jgi:uncharacterized membrane protein
MREPLDETGLMPPIAKWATIVTFGVCGVIMVLNDGMTVNITLSLRIFLGIVTGAVSSYGTIRLIGDIRKSSSFKDFLNNIKETTKRLYD